MKSFRFVSFILLLSACLPSEVRTLRSTQLRPRLHFLRGGGGNSVVLVNGRRVFVFDPKMWPWDEDVEALVAAQEPTDVVVVNSHAHVDHTNGNLRFPNAVIVAAEATLQELQVRSSADQTPRPASVPTVPVKRKMRVHLGMDPIVLVHPQPAHTAGDVYAWLPDQRVLVTGDLFDSGYYPHVDRSRGGTVLGYRRVLDELSQYPADVVIPGHGDQASIEQVIATRDFLLTLERSIASSRAQGRSDNEILEALTPATGEKLVDLGPFSNRRGLVAGLLSEMPRE